MTETLSNLIECQESLYQSYIRSRITSIKSFKDYGPPDLCHLTKEFQKSLSFSKQPSKTGFFHYIYGLDASSPASVSAHLKGLLHLQEKEKKWFSSGKWRITKGLFCIYDVFSRVDIHIEIAIPGGMKLYGYKADESLISVDEAMWERGFISSVLRYIRLKRTNVFKVYDFMRTKEQLKVVLDSFKSFFNRKGGYSYVFDSEGMVNLDHLGNKPLYILVEYLMKRKLMDIATKLVLLLIETNPKFIVFLTHIYQKMGRIPEAITLLANNLTKHPHTIVFLYKQAELLLTIDKFDVALELAQIIVQFSPETFEGWYLLAECYYYKKNYSMVLLIMNSTPIGHNRKNKEIEDKGDKKENEPLLTNPEEKKEINIHKSFFTPKNKNFRFSRFNEEFQFDYQSDFLDENELIYEKLERLAFNKLGSKERKLYELLVRIEQNIGWDKLLELRGDYFYMESDSERIEHVKRSNEDYIIEFRSVVEDLHVIKDNKGLIDSSDEEQEHPLPSFLQNADDNEESIKNLKRKLNVINKETGKNLNMWDQRRSKKITELSNETFETEAEGGKIAENLPRISEAIEGGDTIEKRDEIIKEYNNEENKEELEEKEEKIRGKNTKKENNFNPAIINPNITNPITSNKMKNSDNRLKRLCSKTIDDLFLSLFEDLSLYYEWEVEESLEKEQKKSSKEGEEFISPELNGVIWIVRGLLSERLLKDQTCEVAYRKAVEIGFNLFAWYRLIQFYKGKKSWKAVLVCVGEVIEEFEHEGYIIVNLPRWIQEAIIECVDGLGLQNFFEILKELNLVNDAVNRLAREAESWKITSKDY